MSPVEVLTLSTRPLRDVDPEHLGAGAHLERPGLLRSLTHERPGTERVDDADRREVEAGADHRRVEVRNESRHLLRVDDLGGDTPGPRDRDPPAEFFFALGQPGDFYAPRLGEHAEFLELPG